MKMDRLAVSLTILFLLGIVSLRTSYLSTSESSDSIRSLASKTHELLPSVSVSIQVTTATFQEREELNSLALPQGDEIRPTTSSAPLLTTAADTDTGSIPHHRRFHNTTVPAGTEDASTPSEEDDSDNKEETEQEEDTRPKNLRLAFIGDSVTRYQYLQFVYWLKTNTWAQDGPQSLIFRRTHANWTEFHRHSNEQLQPFEHCDCYIPDMPDPLPPGVTKKHFQLANTTENRYYADDRGNYITFLLKFGGLPTHGHWQPNEVYSNDHGEMILSGPPRESAWSYSWADAIRHHLAELPAEAKPDYVIFNAGLHPNDLATDPTQLGDIQSALAENDMTGIYKTTTFLNGNEASVHKTYNQHDEQYCSAFEHCLDMSWTRQINGRHAYHDGHHLKAHINQRMNLQMLNYLRDVVHAIE